MSTWTLRDTRAWLTSILFLGVPDHIYIYGTIPYHENLILISQAPLLHLEKRRPKHQGTAALFEARSDQYAPYPPEGLNPKLDEREDQMKLS